MPALSQDDVLPLAVNGRIGVWFEERAFGDVLAGIEREKGAEKLKTEHERIGRELAEDHARQIGAAHKPFPLWIAYGLPTGLGALVLGVVVGFFAGRK